MAAGEQRHRTAGSRSTVDQTLSDVGHLMRRAGFGGTPDEIRVAAIAGRSATVDALVNFEQTPDSFTPPPDSVLHFDPMHYSEDLAAWWLGQMITTTRPLQEKMTLFWHGHFATALYKVRLPALMYQQNQIFRQNALARFDDLLSMVYKDPAMLIWLDGDRNTKAAPNENWGREVMELFTLGRGNYTEDDVHACARAFTGWRLQFDQNTYTVSPPQFVPRLHDAGSKTLLGRTGNWNGEDAVRILAGHPATGSFLATRLWRFFASDQPPASAINRLASVYYDSDHSIRSVVQTLFSLPEFYRDSTRSGHIKSPAEFLVTSIRTLGLHSIPTSTLPRMMDAMGQSLFNPPNVGGWPGGSFWISSSTMLSRFNFASLMTGDGPGQNGALINTEAIVAETGAESLPELVDATAGLLGISLTPNTRNALLQYIGRGSVATPNLDAKARGLIHLLLASPEYQVS
jgi:uncharacterized protein (DUF1800 family)